MRNKTTAGAQRKSAGKPGVLELSLLGWLAADPGNRFAISSDHTFACYEKLDPREDGLRPVRKLADFLKDADSATLKEWFGGVIAWKAGTLLEKGYFVRHVMLGTAFTKDDRELFHKAVGDVYIPGSWNLSSAYIGATDAGIDWWHSTGAELHASLLAKIASKQEKDRAAERRAVFGWVMQFDRKIPERIQDMLPQDMEMPLPRLSGLRPMFTARIVRETPDRFYVEDVQALNRASSLIATLGVRSHGKQQYVDRDRLILDHASQSDAAALLEFDQSQQQDHTERCRRAAEELEPIIRRYIVGAVQNEAEHADRMREMLERLSSIRGDKA
jgi:hypothetical protein